MFFFLSRKIFGLPKLFVSVLASGVSNVISENFFFFFFLSLALITSGKDGEKQENVKEQSGGKTRHCCCSLLSGQVIWESQGITSARYTQTTTTCTGNKWARGRGFGRRSYLDPNMVSGKQTHDTHGRVRARVYAFNQLIRLATSVRPSTG